MRSKIIIVLIVLTALSSCKEKEQPDFSKLILGQWEMVNFSTNQIVEDRDTYKKIARNLVLTTRMEFDKKKITTEILGGKTTGTWEIQGNKLIVYDKKKRTKSVAEILKLDDNQLVLMQKQGRVKVVLYFRRM